MKKTNNFYLLVFLLGIFISNSFSIQKTDNNLLLKFAKEYKSYNIYQNYTNKITDSLAYQEYYNWTISLCVNTPQEYPGESGYIIEKDSIYISKTNLEQSPHGNKLYKLYVKDLQTYINKNKEQPIGQVLVKETWNVRQIDSSDTTISTKVKSRNDFKWYSPTTVSQLFIMYKEPKSSQNDEGWKYGIIDIEKNKIKILSNGKISNCISCHKNTKYDRMFGAN